MCENTHRYGNADFSHGEMRRASNVENEMDVHRAFSTLEYLGVDRAVWEVLQSREVLGVQEQDVAKLRNRENERVVWATGDVPKSESKKSNR